MFCLAAAAQLLFTDAPEFLPQAQADDEAPTMTIGSPAPAIDIENWVQDGNGFFKPVTNSKRARCM